MCKEECFIVGVLVRLPPTIIKGPEKHRIFRDDAKVELKCVATASADIQCVTLRLPRLNFSLTAHTFGHAGSNSYN